MDRQKIFDQVWAHAGRMKTKSEGFDPADGGAGCRYRGDNKNKCFIGCLFPDTVNYKEGTVIEDQTDVLDFLNARIIPPHDDIDFLSRLQDIHDGAPMECWDLDLREFAKQYNLIAPEQPLRSAT